ncbi:hypothetical protein PUN28_015390 [Cardiocondyla obscurior]|uniref:Uncharacterized protein n=1 Tax=Cardiocondyla obscurior TaxID=286306 RepID=A0AAW2EWE6_9HYME
MDLFGVPRKVKTKSGPVSIRDLHNLTRPDNTDNQASLRYAGHRGSTGCPRDPIRRDEVRSRRDPQSKEAATVATAVFRRALRKPRLVMVGEGEGEEETRWDSN